ncbi:short transient receptor potential channel 4-like isoform X2 [Leptopilina boulardi]|nr:short transient receptor potential channel 4-like isoform X2 [Leptopilina boulardi]
MDGNIVMVEFLLSQEDIEIGDTVLHAIRKNEHKIALMLLNKLEEISPGLERIGITESFDFPDETTPLCVAAQYGHFEIIATLLKRGHTLKKPHPPICQCSDCKSERSSDDPLTVQKMRFSLYEAVSNPAFICQTSDDPILEAFLLSRELNASAHFEKEYFYFYKSLAKKVNQFATELVGCCRTVEEVELILKQNCGLCFSTHFIYPRLLLAIDCDQKTFVAHPNVQQVIERKWIGDWYEWKIKSSFKKTLMIIPRILMLPIIAVIVVIAPKWKTTKYYKIPVNKFLSSCASYAVFLFFVFLQSNWDRKNQLRGPPNTGYETALVVFVISYMLSAFRLCMIQGSKRFFRSPRNWYKLSMLALFSLAFLFWIASEMDVQMNGHRDLQRKYWHEFDPTLIAEGIFCIATIMAFFKLLFVCQLDYHLGHLQISLGKMVTDVAKFMIIFSIIIMSFTIGLAKFYQYYEGMVLIDDSEIKVQQVDSFVSFMSTLKTLFWSIFCLSAIESADVIIENLPSESENGTIVNKHTFTEFIGYISFATFEFISVIVVLNMLIACMANTFTRVTENIGVEWTFARTELYIDFMEQTTLPPPFNLFPTPGGIHSVVEYIKVLVRPPSNKCARWSIKHCCYIEEMDSGKNRKEFQVIMSQLILRYFKKKETETTASEVDGLRKEMQELRSLLRHHK